MHMSTSLIKLAEVSHSESLRGNVQTLVVLMILVSMMGVLWAVLLLRRARDWRTGLLTALMALVPLYQTVAVFTETGIWTFSSAAQIKAYVDLTINVLFLVAVFLLEFMMEKRHSAEVRLRVIEPGLTISQQDLPLPSKMRPKTNVPQQAH